MCNKQLRLDTKCANNDRVYEKHVSKTIHQRCVCSYIFLFSLFLFYVGFSYTECLGYLVNNKHCTRIAAAQIAEIPYIYIRSLPCVSLLESRHDPPQHQCDYKLRLDRLHKMTKERKRRMSCKLRQEKYKQ